MRHLLYTLGGAVGVTVGCAIPNTLGLPCVTHAHCDAGQHCGPEQRCVEGPPPMLTAGPPMPSTGRPPLPSAPSTSSADGTSTTSPVSSTTVAVGESSGAGSTSAPGESTGASCGVAAGSCEAIDILFVIDSSGSMEDDNEQLIPAFGNINDLVGGLIDGPCSYHIGVTSTEPEPSFQPDECQVRGALSRAGAICPDPWNGDVDHPPWVSEDDNITTLGCLLAVGANNDPDEKQLETVLASVGPELQGPGGCNEGFLRDGVPLIVIIVSDEDDDDDDDDLTSNPTRTGSDGGPGAWFDDLTAIKPVEQLGVVLVASTELGGCDWMPLANNDDGTGAEYAGRMLTFLSFFSGSGFSDHFRTVNLCQPADQIIAAIQTFDTLLADVCEDAYAGSGA